MSIYTIPCLTYLQFGHFDFQAGIINKSFLSSMKEVSFTSLTDLFEKPNLNFFKFIYFPNP